MTTSELTFNQYQEQASHTAVFESHDKISFLCMGLVGEAGELIDKRKKQLRGDEPAPTNESIIHELGDVLWYMSQLAQELGVSFKTIAQNNLNKIQDRKKRNVLKGSGDQR